MQPRTPLYAAKSMGQPGTVSSHRRVETQDSSNEGGVVRKRLLGLTFVSFALAACAGPGASSDDATARANGSSAAVTDCGTFDLSQGEGLPDSAIRCFIEAVQARHHTRLKETRPTIEGDPIPVTYIADADGRVEVTTDSRQDNYSSQIITHQTCIGPTAAPGRLSFAQCSEPTPSRT